MIEIAEELIEPVHRRQILVAIAEMVLAKLTSGIAKPLKGLGNGHIFFLQTDGGCRDANFGEASAQRDLPGYEARPTRRATLLRVIVGELHAFVGYAIDVGRLISHHAEGIS